MKQYSYLLKTNTSQTMIDFMKEKAFSPLSTINNLVIVDTETFKPLDRLPKPFKVAKLKY